MNEKIITIKPKKKSVTGFKDYSNSNISNNNLEVFNYISSQIKNVKIPKNNLEFISKILQSYEKNLKSINLNQDDYLLKDQELLELKTKKGSELIRYLVYRYKYNNFPELKTVEDYPPNLQIEISSVCNLRCVMCYQKDKTFSNKSKGFMGYMNFELFKKIIDEIEGNLEAVTFASRGEPTLNPELEKFLKYSEGKFLGLKINTNATILSEKIINILLSSDLETLVFSIDAANKEMYEKIRVNANFEKIIKNLELFQKIKNKNYKNSNLKVRISGVLINDQQNLKEIKNFYKDLADEFAFVHYTPWESSYDNEINGIEDPCTDLWRRMFVWWDGKVNPCDYDYKSTLSVWNAQNMSIKDIWTSEAYKEIRNKHLTKNRKKIEPCARCIAT